MKYIDTHCHLNLSAFTNQLEEINSKLEEGNVFVVNIGTALSTSKQAVQLSEQYNNMFAAIGLHPSHTYDHNFIDINESNEKLAGEVFDYGAYKTLAQSSSKVVGIGEAGLDYYRLPKDQIDYIKEAQKAVLLKHIQLAFELDKVLILHIRASEGSTDAYDDVINILNNTIEKPRFLIHSYTSNWSIANTFIKLGGYIALNGIVTFDKTGQLDEVVKEIPLDRLLLETDAPYLAPKPFRGKPNTPFYIPYIAEHIAKIKNLNTDDILQQATDNAINLFKITN